ncbi:MAG: hypothetical protein ACRD0U_06710 [Acidimicrobiales bacterium]
MLLVGVVVIVVPGILQLDLGDDPYEPRRVVTVKETTTPDGDVTVERTTSDADDSLVERSLGAGGLLVVRTGAAVLAAFIAGAVVQRTLLGRFAFKAGGIEVPEVTTALSGSEQAIAELASALTREQARVAAALEAAAEATQRVEALERRVGDGERP